MTSVDNGKGAYGPDVRGENRYLVWGCITPDTPCRCGATQPAHFCQYDADARRDAGRALAGAKARAKAQPSVQEQLTYLDTTLDRVSQRVDALEDRQAPTETGDKGP